MVSGTCPYMPEGMRAVGDAMHRAASRFAIAARDAEVGGNLAQAFAGLSEVMQQCVACHGAYRVH
jgi:mono/diheme cytochrome c family protein